MFIYLIKKKNFYKGRKELWLRAYRSESKDLVAEGSHKFQHDQLSKGPLLHTVPAMMWQHCTREEKQSHAQAPAPLLGDSWLSSQYWVFVSWCLQDSTLSEARHLLSMARNFPTFLPTLVCQPWLQIICNTIMMVPLQCFMNWLCLPLFHPGNWFTM